jgi:glycosyltransferase involved in cell wall biosynthesis
MPITILDSRGGFVTARMKQSPLVLLESDADTVEDIPEAVRSTADCLNTRSLSGLRYRTLPRGADGIVTWLAGDSILSGSVATIRHELRMSGQCTYVPVHIPFLEELPFVVIQPRWFGSAHKENYWNLSFRIQSTGTASPLLMEALAENREPWAQLSLGVLAERARAGSGVETLVNLWERAKQLPHAFAALVLRNLAVLMLRHGETAKAERFLEAGMQMYPGYAEIFYLAALHAITQQRAAQAFPLLEQSRSHTGGGFLGSGGESSYRADWLTGRLAVRVGDQRTAFESFFRGIKSDPVFLPALEELLKLRVSRRLIEARRWEFLRAARMEPKFTERIFDYLLLHRAVEAAQHLAQNIPMNEAIRARLEERLVGTSSVRTNPVTVSTKAVVNIVGPFFEHTSLARINRTIAEALLKRDDLDTVLEPSTPCAVLPRMFGGGDQLHSAFFAASQQPLLTIRHQWPPDFRPAAGGKLAAIVPWEYGAVPQVWVAQIQKHVHELWVPSRFVRNVFVRGSVASERIHVIPNGVDTEVFSAEGPTFRPTGSRDFIFLFVGGAIRRKGVDLLLEAFKAAFDVRDDVSFLLAVSGAGGAYQHNSFAAQIQLAANDARGPHVQIITNTMDDATLASLYRGCDVFVLPYRGEGFGMPLVEAMACGKPVITTACGPSQDFASEQIAYLVSAREEAVTEEPPPLGKLTGPFTWFQPDFSELVRTLRYVYEHREEAAQRGRLAAKHVREHFSWPHITRMYLERVNFLTS